MKRPAIASAFTLIELLVVVAIIVVLLALLAPAMDRAIRQAELAVCMAQQSGVGKGATTYAMGFKRYFPHRPSMQNDNGQFERIQTGLAGNTGYNDDRPMLREFMAIKMLQCPLNEPVDYDTLRQDVWILPSTLLLFGGKGMTDPATGQRYRPIRKVGDRMSWSGSTHPSAGGVAAGNDSGQAKRWTFDYLTGETDWNRLFDQVRTAHPDDLGMLYTESLEGESVFTVVLGVRSRWVSYASGERGKITQHYGRSDGSVRRIEEIANHDREQTVEVPEFENGDSFPDNAEHFPAD